MRHILSLISWSCVIAAALIAFARFLHPATFSESAFPILVGIACVAAAGAMYGKRYE
jgi:1,4-dihydroxy-2-naphthoate octaprenyltransferase